MFQKFSEYRKGRELAEAVGLNRPALDFDKKLAEFNSRFDNPRQGEEVVLAAGYNSVRQFLADPDPRKWGRLKIPGQENYTR